MKQKRGDNSMEFGSDQDDEIGGKVTSINQSKFKQNPTDGQRSVLYQMLAGFMEGGMSFEEAVSFVGQEGRASSLPGSAAMDFFKKFEYFLSLEPAERGAAVDAKMIEHFGKDMIFEEEMVVLQGMVLIQDKLPLLKLAAKFAEASIGRKTAYGVIRRAEA